VIRIFRILVPASVFTLFLAESVLIFASYLGAAYIKPDLDGTSFVTGQDGWLRILIVEGMILLGMYFHSLYGELRVRSRTALLQQLSLIFGMAFIAQALISFLDTGLALPLRIMIPGSGIALVAVMAMRLLFSAGIQSSVGARHVLFVGLSPTVLQLTTYFLKHPELGLAPAGYVDGGRHAAPPGASLARLGSTADLSSILDEREVQWIVISGREDIHPWRIEELFALRFAGIRVEEASQMYETALGRVCVAEVRPEELVLSESLQPSLFNANLQSMYSPAIAALAILAALPVIALMAAVLWLSTRGPVIERHRRIGFQGRPFLMYRFRPAGQRFCRLHLDLLPALWNVVRGEMSLVGPQPDRPEFAVLLNGMIPLYPQRTAVKPGLTGLAQLKDYQESEDESARDVVKRLEYDLYYVKHLSPSLDLFVLLRTLRDYVVVQIPAAV
jgi:lipopolysaccharide/colanic/teichoic acid biosynthesis glycosyltransferase